MCSPLPANDPASCASDCQLSDGTGDTYQNFCFQKCAAASLASDGQGELGGACTVASSAPVPSAGQTESLATPQDAAYVQAVAMHAQALASEAQSAKAEASSAQARSQSEVAYKAVMSKVAMVNSATRWLQRSGDEAAKAAMAAKAAADRANIYLQEMREAPKLAAAEAAAEAARLMKQEADEEVRKASDAAAYFTSTIPPVPVPQVGAFVGSPTDLAQQVQSMDERLGSSFLQLRTQLQ